MRGAPAGKNTARKINRPTVTADKTNQRGQTSDWSFARSARGSIPIAVAPDFPLA